MLHSSNEVKRLKPQRMPPARRWKAIRASDLKPGDIVVRTKRKLHGAGRFFWANPEAQGSKSVWDMYNVGLMENKTKDWSTRYYLVTNLDVAEKYKKEPWNKFVFHYFFHGTEGGFLAGIRPESMVLIVNPNYSEEKRIQDEWKLETNWRERKTKKALD